MNLLDIKIAVIGLGYVGLPLAAEFAKKCKVIGFEFADMRKKMQNFGKKL
jgi:UDP-N-acetyl-D-galactosamine dehydrogenase